MAENSKIEWTDHTFNPWRGCTKVSPGCEHCYADAMSKRNPKTLGVWGPNGTRVVAADSYWLLPLKWDREAKESGERRRVFCASLADVFENWTGRMHAASGQQIWKDRQNGVWEEDEGEKDYAYHHSPITMSDVRSRLFRLIDATPNIDWLLLTKRPENVWRMTYDAWCKKVPGHVSQNEGDGRHWSLPSNLWIGVSVEDQQRADERIPRLLEVPAAVRFLSMEPLLGPVDLSRWTSALDVSRDEEGNDMGSASGGSDIYWVIVGGESGHGARPMHPDWVRSLRDQCQEAGVPFFFKQWGEWGPKPVRDWSEKDRHWFHDGPEEDDGTDVFRVGKKAAGRTLDGREWDEFPKEER